MSIIVWIIIGGLAGWIANMIMKTDGSLVKNIVTGIVGALIGGFVMSFFGAAGFTGFNLWSFLVALIGSIILIAVINLLTGKRAERRCAHEPKAGRQSSFGTKRPGSNVPGRFAFFTASGFPRLRP